MNRGILNRINLEKDISNIKMYSDEETTTLRKIYALFNECCEEYKTSNTNQMITSISDSEGNIDKIAKKRLEYIKVLNRAIEIYESTANRIESMFGTK